MRLAQAILAISSSLQVEDVVRLIAVEGADLVHARSSLVVSIGPDTRLKVRWTHGADRVKVDGFVMTPEPASVLDQLSLHMGIADSARMTWIPIPDFGCDAFALVIVHERPLTEAEASTLDTMALQASTALRNAFLHESAIADRRRESTRLAAVSRDLSGILDLSHVIGIVCRAARELVGADGAAFILREGDLVHYSEEDAIAPLWKGRRFPIGRCISGWSVLHREAVVIEDVYSDPRIPIEEYGSTFVKSLAMIPIRPSDPLGAIGVYWGTRRRATQREVELLTILADSAAIALENARLYEEAKGERARAERRADALLKLEKASVELAHDIGERHYDRVIERICMMTGASKGVFWILEGVGKGEKVLVPRWTHGFSRKGLRGAREMIDLLSNAPFESDIPVARACRGDRVIVVPDIASERSWECDVGIAEEQRIRSMIALPLRAQGGSQGALSLYWRDSAPVQDDAIIQTAEVIANQVAAILSISRLASELSRANRLKDEFLSTVSHELRNPLNVIVGYSQLILRNPNALKLPEIREAAEVIHRNAIIQADVVSDLLDLSRLQMGKLQLKIQPAALEEIIEMARDAIRPSAEAKGVSVSVDPLPPNPVVVEVDRARIRQVLGNLMSNALKFTPAGGTIRIRLSIVESSARIDIVDTGQGIEPSFLPEIFGIFRQADAGTARRHGGMGIGLGLVRHLVELHRGRVEVASDGPGMGSTFSVFLPILKAVSVPHPAGGTDVQSATLAGLRFLIVDDSADAVRMLASLLRMEGAFVETACDGPDAVRIAERGDFDLFLCDISMPGMDGYELLRLLRSRPGSAEVPAVALTGFGRKEDVEQAIAAGFSDHLTKPVALEKLVSVARKVISQRTLGI